MFGSCTSLVALRHSWQLEWNWKWQWRMILRLGSHVKKGKQKKGFRSLSVYCTPAMFWTPGTKNWNKQKTLKMLIHQKLTKWETVNVSYYYCSVLFCAWASFSCLFPHPARRRLIKGRQAIDWEEIFANDTYDKELLTKIWKELLKVNNKKTTWLKNGPRTWTNTSPKKIYRQQISIWKDDQYYI